MSVQVSIIHTNSTRQMLKCVAALPASIVLLLILTGCDQLGLDTPAKIEAGVIEDSKAIGGACRNAVRAIEDCYFLNPKAKKAAVAAGWREMDEYMRENKLEGLPPKLTRKKTEKSSDDLIESGEKSEDSTKIKTDKIPDALLTSTPPPTSQTVIAVQ